MEEEIKKKTEESEPVLQTESELDELGEAELRDLVKIYMSNEALLKEQSLKAAEEAEKSKKEAADYKDKWIRCAADFDNFRKRNSETRRIALEEGKADVAKKILPIGDNLARALKMDMDDNTKEGLKMLKRQFDETLKELGIEAMAEIGEDFDPNLHEAVMQAEGEENMSGKIAEVFRCGYKSGDKVIRYAQVAVYK